MCNLGCYPSSVRKRGPPLTRNDRHRRYSLDNRICRQHVHSEKYCRNAGEKSGLRTAIDIAPIEVNWHPEPGSSDGIRHSNATFEKVC